MTVSAFLTIAVIGLAVSSMIWPARLGILLPIAVIILGLMPFAPR
jgi:hypothetical protein